MTQALLIAAVVLGPAAHGCVEPWSLALYEVLLLSMLLCRRDPTSADAPGGIWAADSFLTGPIAVVLAIGCMQLLNPRPLDGPSGRMPFTASSLMTSKALVLWAAFLALLLRAPAALSLPRAKTRLAWTLVLVAAFVAAVGAIQLLEGNMFVYGFRKAAYGRSPFGPYFNRGHAASLMAMCLCVGAGLLASRQAAKDRRLDEGMRPSDFLASQAFLGLLLAGIAAGIALARNRGAVLGLVAAGLGAAFWACGFLRPRPLAWIIRAGLALAPLALAAAILHRPEMLGFPQGLGENSVTWRAGIYRGAWKLLSDFPVWGAGLGAVVAAFPPYKEFVVQDLVDHVHSDWLELPLQVGAVGTIACGVGLLGVAVSFWKRSRDLEPEARFLEAGAFGAVLSFITHAAIEFSFQIPANAAVFLTLLCWLAAAPSRGPEEGEASGRHRGRERSSWQVWCLKAAVVVIMAQAVYPLTGFWYLVRAQGLPVKDQIALYKRSYRWHPLPEIAHSVGYHVYYSADQYPERKAAALREGLAFIQEALRREPMNPYLTRVQGVYLSVLDRRKDAEPMLSIPR